MIKGTKVKVTIQHATHTTVFHGVIFSTTTHGALILSETSPFGEWHSWQQIEQAN